MKKSLLILLFLCLLSFLMFSLVAAQGIFDKDVDEIKEEGSSYLAQEWKKIIENNAIFEPINKFLEFLSPIFKILINEAYSLSWRFFIIFLIWLFVFLNISLLLNKSFFKGWMGYAIGLLVTIILAQLKIFQIFYLFLTDIIDAFTGWTKWLIVLIIIILFIIVEFFNRYVGAMLKKRKEEAEKQKAERSRGLINAFADAIKKAFS